jgi:O-antigen/teichoic acid export membrane protein
VSLMIGGAILARAVLTLGPAEHVERREVFTLAWPLMVTNVSTFFLGTGLDLWLVGAFRSAHEIAIYGAASRLVFLVAMPFMVVSQVVPPIISELHTQDRKKELEHSLREISTIAGLPAAFVLLAFLVAGGQILHLVYGPFFAEGATVLAVLSAARLYAVWTGSSGTALMMTGHQHAMMTITVTSGLLSLVLGVSLVIPFGIVGVAVGTAVAQVVQNTLQLFVARRRLGIWTHGASPIVVTRELLGKA